jgi:choline dehydrogenase-like flavoprotein
MPDAAYDLIVVGSGPNGAAVARTVADARPEAAILMVEAGPLVSEPPGANVRNIADPARQAAAQQASQGRVASPTSPRGAGPSGEILARPGTHLVAADPAADVGGMPAAALSTNVGGMGAHWTCACPAPAGSERVAFIDVSEWRDLFATAQRLLGVTTSAYAGGAAADAVLVGLQRAFPGPRPVAAMPLACRPSADGQPVWGGADVVLGDLVRRPGFMLRDATLARRVIVDGGRATGVEVEDLRTGDRRVIAGQAVVVAADALRTPQVLWASGIRPTALGRYLNDQPQLMAAARVRATGAGRATGVAPPPFRFSQEAVRGVFWVPYDDDAHPFHGQVMHLDASPLAVDGAGTGEHWIVGLGWFCRKDLRAADRVRFVDGVLDAYGMPALHIDYGLSDEDRQAIAAAQVAQELAMTALGEWVEDGGEPRLVPAGSSLHYQGTTRMGTRDDSTSVCDPHGQVWGAEGVFVAGNGVIPTATACNPTATSVALAVRSGRRIADGLRRTAS